jgi:hypothetical protein
MSTIACNIYWDEIDLYMPASHVGRTTIGLGEDLISLLMISQI